LHAVALQQGLEQLKHFTQLLLPKCLSCFRP